MDDREWLLTMDAQTAFSPKAQPGTTRLTVSDWADFAEHWEDEAEAQHEKLAEANAALLSARARIEELEKRRPEAERNAFVAGVEWADEDPEYLTRGPDHENTEAERRYPSPPPVGSDG